MCPFTSSEGLLAAELTATLCGHADKKSTMSSDHKHAGKLPAGTEIPRSRTPGHGGSGHGLLSVSVLDVFLGILQTWQSVVTAAQEAKCPDPVVNRDDNDAAPVGHLLPIV